MSNIRELLENNFPLTSETTVSVEGIGALVDKVRRLFGSKKPGIILGDKATYDKEGKVAVNKLKDAIKKHYDNPAWLSKQTLVEGEVPASDFSKLLEIDGVVGDKPFLNIATAIKRVEAFNNKWNAVLKVYDDAIQAADSKLRKEVEQLVKEGAEDKVIEAAIKKTMAELDKLPDPLDNVPAFAGTSLKNMVPVVGKDDGTGQRHLTAKPKIEPKGVKTVPALTMEEIKQAAKYILQGLDFELVQTEVQIRGLDHSDGSIFNRIFEERFPELYSAYYDKYYWQSMLYSYDPTLIYDLDVVRALETWIDRSIQ